MKHFIGGRINPETNPKHKVISDFLSTNKHVSHGFSSQTDFITDALYEKIMQLSGKAAPATPQAVVQSLPTTQATQSAQPVEPAAEEVATTTESTPDVETIDLGSLIRKSETTFNGNKNIGKMAAASFTNW